jgi:hypothetical protein
MRLRLGQTRAAGHDQRQTKELKRALHAILLRL